jgi:8-oxo-dGTP pyrophosphatase MutT (NUDIX family)
MNQPTQYVAGLLFGDARSKVMLIRKSHPSWMKGKLNGIGGHIEQGELPEYAIHREFAEETGINIAHWNWKHFATISGTETTLAKEPWIVYWYTAAIKKPKDYPPFGIGDIGSSKDEPVAWFDIESITRGIHGDVMPNLCWLIYMAKARVEGIDRAFNFRIQEGYSAEYSANFVETTKNEKELLKQFDTKCPMCNQRHYIIIHQCKCGHTY